MTLLKPNIVVKRVVVSKDGYTVYDELFHKGVNIIRGVNSSGKSTIINCIFFGLGGDFTKWKPEISTCDSVVLELEINASTITVKREISPNQRQSMSIFYGTFTEASASALEGWKNYPYLRSTNKQSFSQVLFRTLGIPEIKSDIDSKITLHQILRLIYIDQITPVDSLMMLDRFDSPIIRKHFRAFTPRSIR